MLKLLILTSLHFLLISSQGAGLCNKCTGNICQGCISNLVLINNSCYDCESCQLTDCSLCPTSDKAFAIIKIVGGAVAGISAIIALVVWLYRRRKLKKQNKDNLTIQLVPMQSCINQNWTSGQTIKVTQYCAICSKQWVNLMTKCGHLYHAKCIKEWLLKQQVGCPLCKSRQMQMIRLYCPRCYNSYIQTSPNSINENFICKDCTQQNQDQIYTQ